MKEKEDQGGKKLMELRMKMSSMIIL